MADKPKKKTRHTNLVLPGEKKKAADPPEGEKDRLGRTVSASASSPASSPAASPAADEPPATVKAPAPEQHSATAERRSAPPGTRPFDVEASEPPTEETTPSGPAPTVEELLEAEAKPGSQAVKKSAASPAVAITSQTKTTAHAKAAPSTEEPKTGDRKPAAGKATSKAKKKSKRKSSLAGMRNPARPARPEPNEDDELPENAIRMPRSGPRFTAARRKKQRRRVGLLVVALLIVGAIVLYISGFYLNVGMALRDGADSLRIAFTPSDGYPASFNLPGYLTADSMGNKGFAALGEKDFYIYSSGGVELANVQHGYTSPGISAGNTRVCLYNRGGREYTIEGRGDTIARRTTEADILFAELSPSGWLALVTTSRYQAALEIYSPVYGEFETRRTWPIIDEIPVLAAFHPDNRTLALGCLAAQGGGLDSVIHILRTGSDEIQATITASSAQLVEARFLSSGRLLAIYNNYAALYDTAGAELARFDYAGRSLMAADIGEGQAALVLGSSARESLEVVLLDDALAPLFTTTADSTEAPGVLTTNTGVFLLLGQKVLAYSREGALTDTDTLTNKALGLVWGGQPLALCSGVAEALNEMLKTTADGKPASPPSSAAGSSTPASTKGASGQSGPASSAP